MEQFTKKVVFTTKKENGQNQPNRNFPKKRVWGQLIHLINDI